MSSCVKPVYNPAERLRLLCVHLHTALATFGIQWTRPVRNQHAIHRFSAMIHRPIPQTNPPFHPCYRRLIPIIHSTYYYSHQIKF